MVVDERSFANVLVIAPRGRIDHQSADAFGDALRPTLARCEGDSCKLVLDLSGVDYMSSVGLRELMLAAKQARAQGGTLVMCSLGATLREIFQISRFDRVFTVFDDVRDAIADIAPEALDRYEREAGSGRADAGPGC